MWIKQVLVAGIGFSAGAAIAAGLFSFIVGLGLISVFADRTHTGRHILLYESAISLGGVLGQLVWIFKIPMPFGPYFLSIYGVASGMFVGCWSLALAEILNIFPIFVRRLRLKTGLFWLILGMALGKGLGATLLIFRK